jgi:hypothetical protein
LKSPFATQGQSPNCSDSARWIQERLALKASTNVHSRLQSVTAVRFVPSGEVELPLAARCLRRRAR